MWCNKQDLLHPDFVLSVRSRDNAEPSIKTFKSRLPGNAKNSDSKWPSPLIWKNITAEVIMEWLLEKYDNGTLSKSQLNTKRPAVHCLFKDYGYSKAYSDISPELSDHCKGLRRKISDKRSLVGG